MNMRASGDELVVFSDYVGEEFVPVITNGNGACLLHAVFGTANFDPRKRERNMYCSGARSLPAKLLGAVLPSLRERVPQQDLLQALETSVFADLWTSNLTSENANETIIFH